MAGHCSGGDTVLGRLDPPESTAVKAETCFMLADLEGRPACTISFFSLSRRGHCWLRPQAGHDRARDSSMLAGQRQLRRTAAALLLRVVALRPVLSQTEQADSGAWLAEAAATGRAPRMCIDVPARLGLLDRLAAQSPVLICSARSRAADEYAAQVTDKAGLSRECKEKEGREG